jgi:hypothetical protein
VNCAVDVLEFHAAVGGEGVSLMELFGECAAVIGGMRCPAQNEKGTDGSENDS